MVAHCGHHHRSGGGSDLCLGMGALHPLDMSGDVVVLQWQPFPLGFDLGVFIILLPIYLVTMAESVGDITATAMLSGQPLEGEGYWRRVRGGVMADGANSVLAAFTGTFPNTTFSQNNGVIQLTGVASRAVGYGVAVGLILLGALPAVSALFQAIPPGVLHGATGLMFAMIALAGLRILRTSVDPARGYRMLAVCAALAFGLTYVPRLAASGGFALPDYLAMLLSFPVASGAIIACIWEALRNEQG